MSGRGIAPSPRSRGEGRGEGQDPAARSRARAWLRLLLGLVAGAAALWLIARGVSREALAAHLRTASPARLALAAAGALVLLALQSLRWWLCLRPLAPASPWLAFRAFCLGYLWNVLLPARAGDVVRAIYVARRAGATRATVLGSAVADLWSDKVGWLAAFPVVCLFGAPPAWLTRALLVVAAAVAAAGVALALVARRAPPGGEVRGARWLHELRHGLGAGGWRRVLVIGLVVAPLPWLWETLLVQLAASAFAIHLDVVQAFAVLCAFNAATIVPSPGNAGTFEAGATLALVAFGVPRPAALATALVYHLTQVVPSALAGAAVMAAGGGGAATGGGASSRDAPSVPRSP